MEYSTLANEVQRILVTAKSRRLDRYGKKSAEKISRPKCGKIHE